MIKLLLCSHLAIAAVVGHELVSACFLQHRVLLSLLLSREAEYDT